MFPSKNCIIIKLIDMNIQHRREVMEMTEDPYKMIVEKFPIGFLQGHIIKDSAGVPCDFQLIKTNTALERIVGLDRSQLIGKRVSELLQTLPETRAEWFRTFLQKSMRPDVKRFTQYAGNLDTWYEVTLSSTEKDRINFCYTDISQSIQRYSYLERFFDIIPNLLCIMDLQGLFIKVNQACETILGYLPQEIEGNSFLDYIHYQETQANEAFLKKFSEQVHVLNHVNLYRCKDGIFRELEWDAHRDNDRIYAIVRDVTEKRKQQKHIEYLSYHDMLTGLFNRQFLEEELKRLNTERNLPISIIMGDINKLKMINDAFGHEKGDELIKKAADVLKQCCRVDDLIARWGGDEFVILLPKTERVKAEEIASRIMENCANEQVNSIAISIALGIAAKTSMEEDITSTLAGAEEAMYKNKMLFSDSVRSNVVNTIISTLYLKDPYEEKHAKRVGTLCRKTARALGLDAESVKKIALGGLMHDIGKIAVDNRILEKPGMLNEDEWKVMRKHAEIGARVISSDPDLADVGEAVLYHHERWDGTGYPKGIREKQIPMAARIIALADSYDAMINQSTYRSPISKEEAIAEIRRNKGIQFDPKLAETFIKKVLNGS